MAATCIVVGFCQELHGTKRKFAFDVQRKFAERQKLIKLADRSGLRLVGRHRNTPRTSLPTIRSASRKKTSTRPRKRYSRRESVKRRKVATPAKQPRSVATCSSSVRSATQVPRRPGFIPAVANTRPLGPCYTCGEIGHLHSFCPRRCKDKSYNIRQASGILHVVLGVCLVSINASRKYMVPLLILSVLLMS